MVLHVHVLTCIFQKRKQCRKIGQAINRLSISLLSQHAHLKFRNQSWKVTAQQIYKIGFLKQHRTLFVVFRTTPFFLVVTVFLVVLCYIFCMLILDLSSYFSL